MFTRRDFMRASAAAGMTAALPQWAFGAPGQKRPNIVVILADDMGIDSVQDLNEKNGIPTPHLNGLLDQGMHFTDAHSGSAVCTPTRYGLLTGRYAWRSRLKKGIVQRWERPLIEDERVTLPEMLKESGYHTACVGKWHLGWDWPKKGKDRDFTQPIKGGPTAHGFDYYFGDDVPNWPPFTWIENDRVLAIPDQEMNFPAPYNKYKGIGAEGWDIEAVLPTITEKCVSYIGEQAKTEKPFFLYYSMTSPHTPIAPSKAFQGKSGISRYADFMMETDWSVGQVIKAIDDNGLGDDTLVIFTTDNGTSPKCNFGELLKHGVDLKHNWRGHKADALEGGHRVPFIVRWPGKIEPDTRSDELISLVDIMATCADVVDYDLPDSVGEDSISLMPVLKQQKMDEPLHEAVICHSIYGVFAVRQGKWKLQFSSGSGGWSTPKDRKTPKAGEPEWQLYDLAADPKETNNLIGQHPDVVKKLTAVLRKFIEDGRSTPGKPQKNHEGAVWWKGLPWEKAS